MNFASESMVRFEFLLSILLGDRIASFMFFSFLLSCFVVILLDVVSSSAISASLSFSSEI